jgi:hypothetical protein
MKYYDVRIEEILEMAVTVEADSPGDAEEIVSRGWKNEQYVLDASHFHGVSFYTLNPDD